MSSAGRNKEPRREHDSYQTDPSGAGIFEVVRDSIPAECRTDLVLGEVRPFGEADGVVLPAAVSAEVN